jgi:hypothetical protein
MKTKTISAVPTGQDIVGSEIQSLRNDIAEIKQAQSAQTAIQAAYPQPFSPFTPAFERLKSRCFAYLPFVGIRDCDSLLIVLVRASDATSDDSIFQNKIEAEWADIDAKERESNFIQRKFPVRLEYSTLYYVWRLIGFVVNGGKLKNPENAPVFTTPPLATFTTPEAFNAPSAPNAGLIIYNELDPITPDTFDAHAGLKQHAPLTDAGAAQTYRQALADWVQSVLTRDYGGTTGVQTIPPFKHILKESELDQVDPTSTPPNRGFVVLDANGLIPGAGYIWTENTVHSPAGKKTTTGNVAFQAANLQTDINQLTNTALVIKSTDPFDGKHVIPFFEWTQPLIPVGMKNHSLALKKNAVTDWEPVVVRGPELQSDAYHITPLNGGTISLTSGLKNIVGVGTKFKQLQEGWKIKVGAQTLTIGTITDDTHMTVTTNSATTAGGQAYTVVIVVPLVSSMKVKPSTTYDVRAIIRARAGGILTLTTIFVTDADGNVVVDTAAPTLAVNPDTGTTGPTVTERGSKIDVSIPLPSANINTLDNYQVILSTSPTAPAGNPTVGLEGVLVIKYGQNPSFNLSYFASLSGDFYLFYRAHNQSATPYSAWSAGTNQHGYSRPVTDFIGTGVPVWPIGLQASGTAPGVPAIANDATHFSIATSDSTDYQAMIAAGTVLHLNIPSPGTASPALDTTRKATTYDLANHRFTVDVAFSAALSNSLAYEIHRGNSLGEKSGTAHTTTLINLGTAGAALAANALLGYSIYMPSQPAADQIRRIKAHASGQITLETATAGALANNACYLICQGSFGYAAQNPLSGIIAGAPFRLWYDADLTQTRFEVIMPTGENAFSADAIQLLGYKKSNGVERHNSYENPTVSPSFAIQSPSYVPVWRMRLQNRFRDGGSDGWSTYTYYVEGYQSGATPGQTYDPFTFAPPEIDFLSPANYPTSRYPDYN